MHLSHARLDRGKAVSHRHVCVIVTVNAQRDAHLLTHLSHNFSHFLGQRTSVRVAENDILRTSVSSHPDRGQRIVPVFLVSVEEVFCVENHAPTLTSKMCYRFLDHIEVFL